MKSRRRQVLKLLAEAPEHVTHAWYSEVKADGNVALAVGIRSVATAELTIAAEKYDMLELLNIIAGGVFGEAQTNPDSAGAGGREPESEPDAGQESLL